MDSTATAQPDHTAIALKDPAIHVLYDEFRLAAKLTLAPSDTAVAVTDAVGQTRIWRTDGRKHAEAQMTGGVIEFQAQWKGDVLQLTRNVPGVATLRREFKVVDGGKTLELKASIAAGSAKIEKKLIFNREP